MYIFEINPLSVASFAIIFSHSEGCIFTFIHFKNYFYSYFKLSYNIIVLDFVVCKDSLVCKLTLRFLKMHYFTNQHFEPKARI